MLALISAFLIQNSVSPEPTVELNALQKSFLTDGARLNLGGGIPANVVAFGDRAVVLATAKNGTVLSPAVVAADFGNGRVAALGHGVILQPAPPIEKLLGWLKGTGKGAGMIGNLPAGLSGKSYPAGDLNRAMSECSAIILGATQIQDGMAPALRKFVEDGGGLLVMDTTWGWLQLNPGKTVSGDHPGQKFLAEMGIGFASGYLDNSNGSMNLMAPVPAHHAAEALRIFEGSENIDSATAGVVSDVLVSVLRDGRSKAVFTERVLGAVRSGAAKGYPVKDRPVLPGDFKVRLGMVAYDIEWRSLPPGKVVAHPVAKDFPGEVGQYEARDRAVVSFPAQKRRWISTGRYAAAGELVSVLLGQAWAGKKVSLRVGGHADDNWGLDSWERWPSITLEVPIVDGKAKAANPFGGIVYLVCSESLPAGTAVFDGTVAAPVYFLGSTTDSDWKRIRRSGAPWGEIVGKHSAICVPAEVLKTLDDPKAVAEYFDEMVREAEKFYAVEPGTTEHRYQADRQIVAGYMHAGYPIMTWLDVTKRFVDIKVLRGREGGPLWGFYHELGHNYQESNWTWDGWGETTNNLFSEYGQIHFNQQVIGHGAMTAEEVSKRLAIVKAAPGSEKFYNKDPWFGL
ncbi:MAG: M60 family metallopeptidase, partial [Fimbriimonadaceae bacterium]